MAAATEAVVDQAITALVAPLAVVDQAITALVAPLAVVVARAITALVAALLSEEVASPEEALSLEEVATTVEAVEDTINLVGQAHLVAPLTVPPQAHPLALLLHTVGILQK